MLSALALWGFAELVDDVLEGDTQRLDEAVMAFLHGTGGTGGAFESPMVREAVRDVTALGSFSVLAFFVAFACGYLAIAGHRRAAVFVLVAVLVGLAGSLGLKAVIGRPRPEFADAVQAFTKSFPSGHAMLSAVVYLTLGTLLARLHRSWRVKCFLLGVAVLVAVLVGVSRVLLGVHWPTDVLAGWAIGGSWALLCGGVLLMLQRRHALDAPGVEEDGDG